MFGDGNMQQPYPGSPFGSFNQGGLGGPFGGNGFNNGMNGQQNWRPQRTETKFAKAFLAASIMGALLFFFVGEMIYHRLIVNVNSILFMGVYFAALGLILAAALFLAARLYGFEFSPKSLIVSMICILLLFILGMFFEFLYEFKSVSVTATSGDYIFAIDNSSSMGGNDPLQKRIAAVRQLVESQEENTRFAVYTFSDDINCIREMGPASEQFEDMALTPEGGTAIVGALTKIMDDMKSGRLPYDKGTQVILLTDGYATDTDFFGGNIDSVLKDFSEIEVSISTVGLGDVDERFLENISGKTGGQSVTTDNVEDLGNAMVSVARTSDTDRNLLSVRKQADPDWLYALMRIVFLSLLGALYLGIKITMTDESVNALMIIISSAAGSVIGALIIEFGLSIGLSGILAHLLLVLCISLTITMIERVVNMYGSIGTLGRL